jgi:hypothetical protein
MLNATRLVERLIASGIAKPGQIAGCSDSDITRIEGTSGVQLPAAYKAFLRVVGKNAGQLMGDIDFLYEGVLALNARAAAILDNWEEGKLVLPAKAFVFSMRQGEQFMFFIADGRSDDPPVYYYFEGWGQFKKAANSLWEVIEAELEMQERLRQEPPTYH